MITSTRPLMEPLTGEGKRSPVHMSSSDGWFGDLASSLGIGLSVAFDSIRHSIADRVALDGEELLQEAIDHAKDSLSRTVEWGKRHPVTAVVGVAAVLAVTAMVLATLHSPGGERVSNPRGSGRKSR